MVQIKHSITGEVLYKNKELTTLSGAYLNGAYLNGANLSDANLSGANLSDANLSGTYLRGADLRDADLTNADLTNADLSGADLINAYLRGADLSGANLSGTYLRGAKGYLCLGTDSRNYHFRAVLWANGWMISAGCRWFTVEQAVQHWTDKGNKDALARVAIVAAHSP